MKDSDVVTESRCEFLKRTRIQTGEGMYLKAHDKHAHNIVKELGLEGCNPVRALGCDEAPPEYSSPLDSKQPRRFRKRVVSGMYLARD